MDQILFLSKLYLYHLSSIILKNDKHVSNPFIFHGKAGEGVIYPQISVILYKGSPFQDGRIPLHYTVVGKTPELARQLETLDPRMEGGGSEEDPMAIEVCSRLLFLVQKHTDAGD